MCIRDRYEYKYLLRDVCRSVGATSESYYVLTKSESWQAVARARSWLPEETPQQLAGSYWPKRLVPVGTGLRQKVGVPPTQLHANLPPGLLRIFEVDRT